MKCLFIAIILLGIKSSMYTQEVHTIPLVRLSEKVLVQGLSSIVPIERDSCAAEIRKRLENNTYVIEKGNVFESKTSYWVDRLGDLPRTIKKENFEELIGLEEEKYKPNYKNIKFYQLDHFHLLRTRLRKKRITLDYLSVEPIHFNFDPPSNFSGNWRCYYIHGIISSKTEYLNGEKHGMEYIYSANGNIAWEKKYDRGKLILIFRYRKGKRIRESLDIVKCENEEEEK